MKERSKLSVRPKKATMAVVALALLALTAGVALGAAPKPNGLYSGAVTAHGYVLKVEVHVAASGKTATARFYCNGTTISSSPQDNAKFPITNGTFSGQTQFKIYGVSGSFTTASSAKATLRVQGSCSTAAVANYKLTLRLSG